LSKKPEWLALEIKIAGKEKRSYGDCAPQRAEVRGDVRLWCGE